MTTDDSAIERLIELLDASRHGVVFTGAGISTESGIPDFRSPGGIWAKFRPIDFQEFMASEQARREYWRRKFAAHEAVAGPEPSTAMVSCFTFPPIEAAMRADAMLDKGDLDGYAVWKRRLRAVEALQRAGPRPGGKVH